MTLYVKCRICKKRCKGLRGAKAHYRKAHLAKQEFTPIPEEEWE